jgi:hypothetical protein
MGSSTQPPPEIRQFPQIEVENRQLRDISQDCLSVLRDSNQDVPYLFTRGGAIVHVSRDENGRSTIVNADVRYLAGCLTRHADFASLGKGPKNPPVPAIHDILSRSQDDWQLPPLISVNESPVLRPDGIIELAPGYD